MSNLLSQASLVMIPSGYKEDVVYSQIPTSGAGDLSFTRASNGTRINSAGLVEVVAWNLLSYSEEFNNTSGWLVQNGASITANSTTAPNGTTTADTISYGTSSISACYQSVTNGAGVFTISVYAKCSSGTQSFKFIIYNGIDGQVDSQVFTVTTEWQRFEKTYTVSQASNWYIANANDSATRSIFIWGAQLNIGSTAKPYFPTTDRLNVPRLTYQNGGGGCPSLLLEKQSTNEANYSQQFDDSYWYKNYQSVTANATTSPDGTQNADLLIPSAGTGDHYLLSQTVSNISGQVVTLTLFVKKKENDYFYFGTGGASAFGAVVYQFSTNTFVVSGLSATATNFGNGWIRLSITGTTGATDLRFLFTPTDSTGSRTYNANGTDGTYIWGAQSEASSYPTSYIPTTSSSATRVADACFKTGISSLIGQTQGTIFWDINFVADGTEQTINISDGTNFIYLQKYTDNKIYTGVYNGSFVGSITSSVLTSGRKKIAFGYILNSLVLYINGVLIGTDLTSTIPTCDRLSLTVSNTGSIETNNFILFPTKLTNAELASITTL